MRIWRQEPERTSTSGSFFLSAWTDVCAENRKHATKEFASEPPQADWSTCRKNSERRKKHVRLFSVCEQTTVHTRANRQDETLRPMSIRPPPRTCSFAFCSTSQHRRPRQLTASLALALSPVRAVQLVGSCHRVIRKRLGRSKLPCQDAPRRSHLQMMNDPRSRPEIRLANGADRIEDVTACFPPTSVSMIDDQGYSGAVLVENTSDACAEHGGS